VERSPSSQLAPSLSLANDAEVEKQGREPEGREPRGEKPKRGASVGTGVTATRRDGFVLCASPWSRDQKELDEVGVEDFVFPVLRTAGESWRNGKKGRCRREAGSAENEGKPLKGEAQGCYGMKQGRKGMSGTTRQEVEKA
jgi:hypothetical protein